MGKSTSGQSHTADWDIYALATDPRAALFGELLGFWQDILIAACGISIGRRVERSLARGSRPGDDEVEEVDRGQET